MTDFKKVVSEQLESFDFGSAEAQGKVEQIRELQRELESAMDRVAMIQMEIRHTKEELNIELAKSLRRRMPKLGIRLGNGRCSMAHRSTNLDVWPDLDNGTWAVEPNQYGRSFSRRYGPALQLHNRVDPLADAIVQYFSKYKTLL